MKKTMKTLAALGLVCAMGTVSFAAESNTIESVTGSNTATHAVNATFSETGNNVEGAKVYSVKIDWTDMTVKYNVEKDTTYKWNVTSLKYEEDSAASSIIKSEGWNDNTVKIDVTNSSNAAIKASATYAKKGEETITFDKELELKSAALNGDNAIQFTDTTTKGVEQKGTITGTISGGKITNNDTLGTITVTITTGNN